MLYRGLASSLRSLSYKDTVRSGQSVGRGLRSSGSNKLPGDAAIAGPWTRL